MSSASTEDRKYCMKLKKKLRDIEKIEMKLACGEAVDSLQLKKAGGKATIVHELEAYKMFEVPHGVAAAGTKQSDFMPHHVEVPQDSASAAVRGAVVDTEGTIPYPAARAPEVPRSTRWRQTPKTWAEEQQADELDECCKRRNEKSQWGEHGAANKPATKGEGKGKRQRPAAGVVLLLGHGTLPDKVVITCQLRKGQPSWELPKGGLEDADRANVEAAAAREFWEETGVANELAVFSPLQGYGQSRIHWFLARIHEESELIWEPIRDKDTIEAKCMPLDQAMDILRGDHKQLLSEIVRDVRRGKLQWP
eukprot:CAMPEP_0172732916 /NCGR_PEP_ID=MMETSP1074-20121228/105709_1 /TAXON_ID=2916 /ORGANISM="Ceratium fusus, Strain PA161109" /LENGTH=307 /DNA_ID=CAMNT_0013561321 /DNA_START=42 /DNA_END=965 /DNA_ORIENTATION=-